MSVKKPRLLQALVPADALGQQDRPGEKQARVPAEVEALEAALGHARRAFGWLDWKLDKEAKTETQYAINGLRLALASCRRRASTGGNAKLTHETGAGDAPQRS